MDEYMNKEVFLSSMGLAGDETKYGNRDAEHQHRSYSTYMSYEIIDSVEDSIVDEELAPVRHGQWLCVDTDTEQFFLCNRCKKKEYWESNYCPNCGCLMDGDDDE